MHAKLFWCVPKRRVYGKRSFGTSRHRRKINSLHLTDKSIAFNTSRVEALELQNLFFEVAETLPYQLYLEQRVGEHMQETTFPDRDDENWLCHSVYEPKKKNFLKEKSTLPEKK